MRAMSGRGIKNAVVSCLLKSPKTPKNSAFTMLFGVEIVNNLRANYSQKTAFANRCKGVGRVFHI